MNVRKSFAPFRAEFFTWCVAAIVAGCARVAVSSGAGGPLHIKRPAGQHAYRFTSTETGPSGRHILRVMFRLATRPDGTETAMLLSFERGITEGDLRSVSIDPACAARIGGSPGVAATVQITPPPHDVRALIDPCVPEDLFGATSDILPLLMIQVQPAYRASELRQAGQRVTFAGYNTGWQSPPTTLDARVVADSGVTSLDSLQAHRMIVSWDSSPMTVDIVRTLAPGQHALLHGHEWFAAELAVDPLSGDLLGARTRADSLVLSLVPSYRGSSVPPFGFVAPPGAPVVRITRTLLLERLY